MMYHLLSKEDFATLYKYGEVNIKVGGTAESDDPREAVMRLFAESDPFEYAQERLIITSENSSPGKVKMIEVKDIFPLDSISKNLFESQFNGNLIFRDPVFHDIADSFLKKTVMERTTVSGINALRAIFGLAEETDSALIQDIILGKSFLRNHKYFDVPFEDRTPYSILIAYNRYHHYPKDNRGFFYDAADCFMYSSMYGSLQEKGIRLIGYDSDIVASLCQSYFSLLETIPANSVFTDIVGVIEESKPKIADAISAVYSSVRFLALYFYVKDLFLAEESITIKGLYYLYSIGKKYPEDFSKLLSLIGGFFGYTWVYDRYYEFQECPFLSHHYSVDSLPHLESPTTREPVSTSTETTPVTPDQESPFAKETVPELHSIQLETPLTDVPSLEPKQGTSEPIVPLNTESEMSLQSIVQSAVDSPVHELDVHNIIKEVLKGCGAKRKSAFEAKLKENKDLILQFVLAKDEEELRNLYPKLDQSYDLNKDKRRIDVFVKTCQVPKMFNE